MKKLFLKNNKKLIKIKKFLGILFFLLLDQIFHLILLFQQKIP